MSPQGAHEDDTSDAPRRTTRLSSDQSRARVLAEALTMLETTGLTVSLEHLSIEDLIRAADVPRSAFYRLWRSKDLFYADLLEHLTMSTSPADAPFDTAALQIAAQVLRTNAHRLAAPDGRRAVIEEMWRLGGQRNVDALAGSTAWRDATALITTINGVADLGQRESLVRSLRASEERRIAIMAGQYEQLVVMAGCGLQPGVTFTLLARIAARIVEGFVQGHFIRPELTATRIERPGLDGELVPWHPAALSLWSAFSLLLDFDPPIPGASEATAPTGAPDSADATSDPDATAG